MVDTPGEQRPKLVTQSAYARHRGCARSYISKLVASGRLKLINGLVDVAAADAELGSPTSRAPLVTAAAPDSTAPQRPDEPLDVSPGGEPPSYSTSRRWREYYSAQKARQDWGERNGKLVDADEIEHFLCTLFRHVRQGVLTLPSRVAPKVHDAQTIPEIERILREHCHEALRAIANAKVIVAPSATAPRGNSEPHRAEMGGRE